ncbi:DNA polymerase III delta subunit [Balneicella halophila]|uniref:DNA polymerase III subunit delta n=1 Tax=Balneicella halophila TaxID=1537566 RepID=A0A7L4UR49_BALHA|nr:DNA polymerase III subunit delta [Balneicella halophila]PVX50779.1 DNA polymerase III delta subunit [Balneicella halophila]
MTFDQIYNDIKQGNYRPIYFLMGNEGYYIDKISDAIEHGVLSEEEKAFNQTVLYGKDVEIGEVITVAKRYPMMAPYQVLIVKEAQEIRNIEELALYADNPLETTILVICYRGKTIDKRKSLAKKLSKSHILFESKRLYDNKVFPWVVARLKEDGYSINPKAGHLLVEYLGSDLAKVNNELQKLQLVLPKGTEITASHIEENIGISKDFNNFELQNAVGKRDITKAIRIARYFDANPKDNPFVVTVSVLYSFFAKIFLYQHISKGKGESAIAKALGVHPYFLKDYIAASKNFSKKQVADTITLLREYDLKSKGVDNTSTSNGELLQELIFKILFT